MGPQPSLARRLGLADAVALGLGSMLGAGVFASFAPAAAAAGAGLLGALGIAAIVAYCNAIASAQLAARYPESGGTYRYGRQRLGPAWGFLAGWGFVIGKTASCAAMAITFGAYTWPAHPTAPAIAVVVVLTGVNCFGIAKTARLTRALVALTLLALTAVVVAALGGGHADLTNLTGWSGGGLAGIAQAAALLFFTFAGYARVATLGEEVREPARTIPLAIPLALGIVVAVYAVVGAAALAAIGPTALAHSAAPLVAVVQSGTLNWLTPVVRIGGAIACAGVLLSLLVGVGRTVLAMARDHELPHVLAAVHRRHQVPRRAEILLGAAITIIVAIADVRHAIGMSSFAILTYYAIANAAAFTLPGAGRWWRRPLAVLGATGCATLAVTLPLATVVTGAAVLAIGLAGRAIRLASYDPSPGGATMPHRQPTMRSRELGDGLRHAMEKAGLTGQETAKILSVTPSFVSMLLTGTRGAKETDIAAFLGACRVIGPERERLLGLCRDQDTPGWLQQHGSRLPKQLTTLIDYENKAVAISDFQPMVVSGLLQTADYARALIRETGIVPPGEVDDRVAARLARQSLFNRERPARFTYYLHELALRLPVGGPAVMAEQLEHLLRVSRRSYLTLRVVPAARGGHAGIAGPFMLMEFARFKPVAYLDSQTACLFLELPEEIAAYQHILGVLAQTALSERQSTELIAALATGLAAGREDHDERA